MKDRNIIVVGLELSAGVTPEHHDLYGKGRYVSLAAGVLENLTSKPSTDYTKGLVAADKVDSPGLKVGELPYTSIRTAGSTASKKLQDPWNPSLRNLGDRGRIVLVLDIAQALDWQKQILNSCKLNISHELKSWGYPVPEFALVITNSNAEKDKRLVSPEEVQALVHDLKLEESDVVKCPSDKTGKINIQPLLAHLGIASAKSEEKEKKAAPSLWSEIRAAFSGKSKEQDGSPSASSKGLPRPGQRDKGA